jgi:hypothetical protein
MTPEEYRIPEELLLNLNRICMNKAEKRLLAEECVRIFNLLDALQIGHFAVVRAPGIQSDCGQCEQKIEIVKYTMPS